MSFISKMDTGSLVNRHAHTISKLAPLSTNCLKDSVKISGYVTGNYQSR
jgi:hypothetical protein